MSNTHDLLFPRGIALGAVGGPERQTDITTLGSGEEKRNQRWARSRRRYAAGYGVKTSSALHEVVALFEAARGRMHAFRFRDPLDWKSCAPEAIVAASDQAIGVGDGITKTFALTKAYGTGDAVYRRPITRPVAGTVVLAVDAVATAAAVDEATGEVTFAVAPPEGATITAGFAFDVPVRFDTDRLAVSLSHFEAGEIPDIPLLEVLS